MPAASERLRLTAQLMRRALAVPLCIVLTAALVRVTGGADPGFLGFHVLPAVLFLSSCAAGLALVTHALLALVLPAHARRATYPGVCAR